MATNLIFFNANKENIWFGDNSLLESGKNELAEESGQAADSKIASIGNKMSAWLSPDAFTFKSAIHQQAASPKKTLKESFQKQLIKQYLTNNTAIDDDDKKGKWLEFKVCREIPMHVGETKWHVDIHYRGLEGSEQLLAKYRTRSMLVSKERIEG